VSNDSRRQISSVLDTVAGIGLKLGAVMVGLSLAYLLYVIFGPKLSAMKSMKADEKDAFLQSVGWARAMLRYGSIGLVLGLCITYFYEETIGLILTLVGGLVYFFSPSAFSSLTLGSLKQNLYFHAIVNDIATVGLICVVPGILLLVRDVIMRVVNRFSSQHDVPAHAVEEETTRKPPTPKPYEKCWDMALCNERAKRFCRAWEKRKSCWQVKSGCLCDQEVIQKALLARDRELAGGDSDAQTAQATDTRPKVVLSGEQKKARCRACTIYMEHQRQKFRIASPTAIVLVALVYVLLYSRLAAVVYNVLKNMDRFMSFVTLRHGADASFASQGSIVTTLAMICLGVVLLSFTLRALEYLIFDLQITPRQSLRGRGHPYREDQQEFAESCGTPDREQHEDGTEVFDPGFGRYGGLSAVHRFWAEAAIDGADGLDRPGVSAAYGRGGGGRAAGRRAGLGDLSRAAVCL
jgi:hypothetical protein